jgi:Icc-related predicted phosphoesterase
MPDVFLKTGKNRTTGQGLSCSNKDFRRMKILCVSDTTDSLIYSDTVKDRFGDIDYILAAGDLSLDYLEFIVSSLNKPLLFVFGNHNLGDFAYYSRKSNFFPSHEPLELNLTRYFAAAAGATHIGGKAVREGTLLFAGLGGSMRYNNGENQFTEFEMKLEMFKLFPRLLLNKLFFGRYIDILLTHAPPFGIHDRQDRCHRGFKSFLWFMRVFKPKYLVHGHIHIYGRDEVRRTQYYSTMVVNAYSHIIIEFNEGEDIGDEI